MISRRGLITGLVSFVAAPAIVRASSLMPVRTMIIKADGWQDFSWIEMPTAEGSIRYYIENPTTGEWEHGTAIYAAGYTITRNVAP